MLIEMYVYYNNKMEAERRAAEAEKENISYQFAALKKQLNPHFLFNTLTAIQELCYVDPVGAASTIASLSEHLRTCIDFVNLPRLIPFWEEIAKTSERAKKVVETFRKYNDVMAKAGKPYRY